MWKLDPPDISALTDAAWQALQGRDELSRGARLRVEANFDIEKIAEKYIEVLLGD